MMLRRLFYRLMPACWRRVPPASRREHRVYDVVWIDPVSLAEWPVSVTVAFYDDGRPCEVFAQLMKSGGMLDAALICSARLMSHLLQRGVSASEVGHIVGEYGSPVDTVAKTLAEAEL